MSTFEYIVSYLCLIVASLFAFLTQFGFRFFNHQDYMRGAFFFVMSAAAVIAWVGPLMTTFKPHGIKALKFVVLLITVFMLYRFLRETYIPALPRLD